MRRLTFCLLVLGLSTIGCTSSDAGGSGGDLQWPPEGTAHFDEYGILNTLSYSRINLRRLFSPR